MPEDQAPQHRTMRRPEDSIGFLLWQAAHGWQRHLDQTLAPTGLTHLQFAILMGTRFHARSGHTVSQAELARWSKIHPMQVSQVVKTLVAKDLLTRLRRIDDARSQSLELTPAGAALAETALPLVEAAHAAFFAGFEQLEAPLRCLLRRIHEDASPGRGSEPTAQ